MAPFSQILSLDTFQDGSVQQIIWHVRLGKLGNLTPKVFTLRVKVFTKLTYFTGICTVSFSRYSVDYPYTPGVMGSMLLYV